jgi:hypothetical protein
MIFSTVSGAAAGERRNVPLAFMTLPMTLAIRAVGALPSSRALSEGSSPAYTRHSADGVPVGLRSTD